MKDAEVKALVTRFDKHNAEAKLATAEWRRRHLLDLVRGEIEPAGKPAKPAKAPRSTRKKNENAGPSQASAGAVRKR
jgi:hypothetical protein